ncbi:FxsA family protein [Ectothiorhodospiraceae bacterium BW-2]|nr:FxsA family protein [Ectothiorhodospiraceae bacterium BW-2]
MKLLIFLLFPALEIYLFIVVGEAIGALNTVLLIFATLILGFVIMSVKGRGSVEKWKQQLREGAITQPVVLFDALYAAVSGVLLIIPGFISDTIGLLLLLRPIRTALLRQLLSLVMVPYAQVFSANTSTTDPLSPHPSVSKDSHSPSKGRTIEGDYKHDD